MAIDAFTLVAQIVNFLLLLLLLRVFLFRPVKRVMAERERRIAEAHGEAEEARSEAQKEAEELRREREELERHRRERLSEIDDELEHAREERLSEVREEAEKARAAWRDDLDRQHDELLGAVRRNAAGVLGDALRHGWRELADEELEARALSTFAARLRDLDDDTRTALAEAAAAGPVRIATAFEPSASQRRSLLKAVRGALGGDGDVEAEFERDAELLAGVTLRAGDLRLGWSVRAQVDELERIWAGAADRAGGADAAEEDGAAVTEPDEGEAAEEDDDGEAEAEGDAPGSDAEDADA